MFESITFSTQNKTDTDNPLDIGRLMECMLFYSQTTVVANQGILKQLVRVFGGNNLISLIEAGALNVTYTESNVGIITNTINGVQVHDAIEFSSPQHTYQDVIRRVCIEVTGKEGKGRRAAQKLENKIQVSKHDHLILEGTRHSILNQDYIDAAIKLMIKSLVPEVTDPSDIRFYTRKDASGIQAETNINFEKLNKLYHKRVSPQHSTLTSAHLFSQLLTVEKELYFSSQNLSELASSQLSADLATQKIDYVINKSKKSSESLAHFNGFIFDDSKSIREAVNSGKVEITELVEVVLKASDFKKWIAGINPDQDLIKNYYQEVTKETVVDKLPGKSVRWGVFTGLGLAADAVATGGLGTATGLALGALDTFYIDKLITGWKPSQFIDEELKTLIDENT